MTSHSVPHSPLRIGVDLGGTKIEAIALDSSGHELARPRVPTPRGDYEATVRAIRDLVAEVETRLEQTGTVGVATPGALSPRTGVIKNANSQWLNGRALDKDLATALERPVRLANDANCLAVSEATDGAAAGLPVVFGVILGTGVGGGIALGGHPLNGRNAIGGEWGHTPLPWPSAEELREGRPCYCGRAGCIETWLSGPAVATEFQRRTGQAWTSEQIVAAAERGDAEALAALERYAGRLARGLAVVVNILDPDAIVLGGGLSNLDFLYRAVPALLSKWCFSDGIDTPLFKSKHGDSSGVRGAAWLWPL